jgi:colicin import membrane protein
MFTRFRTSMSPLDIEQLEKQAAEVGGVLKDAAHQTKVWAEPRVQQAGEWIAPRGQEAVERADDAAQRAVEWAAPFVAGAIARLAPRIEQALQEAADRAQPTVEKAAGAALPVVDETHERLVADLLPRLEPLVSEAVTTATLNANRAHEAARGRLIEIGRLEVPAPKTHRFAKIMLAITGVALVGAAIAAWQRSKPTTDPWAEQPWEPAEPTVTPKSAKGNAEPAAEETPAPSDEGSDAGAAGVNHEDKA